MTRNIALAGPGGLGKAFINILKTRPEFNTVILSRKPNASLPLPVLTVDYSSIHALTTILESHSIDTIISTLAITDEPSKQAQLNLIAAAEASKPTTRFIPSEFGIVFHQDHVQQFPLVANKLAASAALAQTTSLEYSLVHCGFFLDFFANPQLSSVPSGINPFPIVLDIAHNIAAVPGDGNTPNVFTHTTDVAKYVVASLDLAKWPVDMFIVGDKLSWMEMVSLLKGFKNTDFKVIHDNIADLKDGKLTELPSHQILHRHMPKAFADRLMSALEYWSARGEFDFKGCMTLNETFPEIQAMTAREFLGRNWGQSEDGSI